MGVTHLILFHHKGIEIMSFYSMACHEQFYSIQMHLMVMVKTEPKISSVKVHTITIVSGLIDLYVFYLKELH